MAMKGMTCPNCSAPQSWQVVRFGVTFRCSDCGQLLQVNPQYSLRVGYLSFGLALSIWIFTGFQGLWGFFLVPPLGFVFAFVLGTLFRHIMPPRLEVAADVHLNG